ncbi:MAG TPA: thiamine pyrophosphate-dependent enzyme, partial [Elusimicrobiales bacterium]|nr:thiamine pyrophosphate-dependent enzyme [Elusimicrobiales bacterium]
IDRDLKWLETPAKQPDLGAIKLFKAMHPRYINEEKMKSDEIPIKPQRLVSDLRKVLPSDTILFADIGTSSAWVHYFDIYEPNTFFVNFGYSSMGHAVAGCIGAKLANPDSPVFALVGDGAFAMNGMEVHTAVEKNIPVVWVVINNGGFGIVHQGERMQFGGKFNTSVYSKPLEIAKIASGLGAKTFRIENPKNLIPCFEQSLKLKRPVVIDVIADISEGVPMEYRTKLLNKSFLET